MRNEFDFWIGLRNGKQIYRFDIYNNLLKSDEIIKLNRFLERFHFERT